MNDNKYNVVCFGEILWDVLPDGSKPGGAPMNVAYHLKQLGQYPATLTRVGDDEKGKGLKEILQKDNISIEYVQTDSQLPTGWVNATVDQYGNMSYEITENVAWDNISIEEKHLKLVEDADYFIFGTLAVRHPQSYQSLSILLESAKYKILDINLRPPFYSKDLVFELLHKVDCIKLNEDELAIISQWISHKYTDLELLNYMQGHFGITKIIVTYGDKGALYYENGKIYRHPSFKVDVVDTVGSGDSFLAAFLSQTIQKKDPDHCLQFASAVGALVASSAGAWVKYTPSDIHQFIELQKNIV